MTALGLELPISVTIKAPKCCPYNQHGLSFSPLRLLINHDGYLYLPANAILLVYSTLSTQSLAASHRIFHPRTRSGTQYKHQ